jgi:uncharacterized damage-inducible protein DinB
MTFDDLQMLLEYHYWARDRMLAVVETLPHESLTKPLGNSFPSIFDTVVHLYAADWIWCTRWHGESPTSLPPSSAFADLTAVRGAWSEEEQRIRALLTRLGPDDIAHAFQYRGWDGRLYTQPFWQMLQHLVNHGSYHRGQVTTMLRQVGMTPPKPMDLIAFYRERAAVGA